MGWPAQLLQVGSGTLASLHLSRDMLLPSVGSITCCMGQQTARAESVEAVHVQSSRCIYADGHMDIGLDILFQPYNNPVVMHGD